MNTFVPINLKTLMKQNPGKTHFKPTRTYSTWNSVQCYVVGWVGGEFGGEWIHIHVWLRPFAIHWKLSQHC